MERFNKDKVFRLWSLIVYTNGKSRYNKDIPILVILPGEKSKRSKTDNFGEYYQSENIIKIWCGPHVDFEDLASTMLHEYAHYLQFWPWYTRYRSMYTYEKNPYEIKAREFEKLAPGLVKLTTEDEWLKFQRKNKGIIKIYEDSRSSINVKT